MELEARKKDGVISPIGAGWCVVHYEASDRIAFRPPNRSEPAEVRVGPDAPFVEQIPVGLAGITVFISEHTTGLELDSTGFDGDCEGIRTYRLRRRSMSEQQLMDLYQQDSGQGD